MKTIIRFPILYILVVINISFAQWSNDPNINNAISTAVNNQVGPSIISDGSGGAIITWTDRRAGTYDDIYVQRINSAGVVQWTADGVAICTAADNQGHPMITSDGSGGAIITWEDYRNGANYDIYAQRINNAGVVQWTADGVALSTAWAWQYGPMILPDGTGGAIITWEDYRNGSNYDIYAQRIDSTGVVQWTVNGVTVSTAADEQVYPMITSDGSGGAIITWEDKRNGSINDIYATRIFSDGSLPVQLASFTATVNTITKYVCLEWMTISETNCYGFDIERRTNISKDSWIHVGFVPGSGYTTSPMMYSFTDKTSPSNGETYRLKQIDRDGTFTYSQEIHSAIATSKTFALLQNYPDPFNPVTTIRYSIPTSCRVSLDVYNVLGQQISELVHTELSAGWYETTWNANVSSGLYFYRIDAVSTADPNKRFTQLKKMMLLK